MTTPAEEARAALLVSKSLNGVPLAAHKDDGFRFDKTISLGNVISIAMAIGAVMFSWSTMDKRVVVLEEARVSQRERDNAQDLIGRDKFQEVRDALADLRRSVEKVSDKVGAK